MTINVASERERVIARVMLSEVIRKLEEALRLTQGRPCTRVADDPHQKETHE